MQSIVEYMIASSEYLHLASSYISNNSEGNLFLADKMPLCVHPDHWWETSSVHIGTYGRPPLICFYGKEHYHLQVAYLGG